MTVAGHGQNKAIKWKNYRKYKANNLSTTGMYTKQTLRMNVWLLIKFSSILVQGITVSEEVRYQFFYFHYPPIVW